MMEVKQVILVHKNPHGARRLVFDSHGKLLWGDPEAYEKLVARAEKQVTLTLTVRGQEGECASGKFNAAMGCVAGDLKVLQEAVPPVFKPLFKPEFSWQKWVSALPKAEEAAE